MIRRSVHLAVVNPLYAFLEEDYANSNLSQVQLKTESNAKQNIDTGKDEVRNLKSTIILLLVKINPLTESLIRIPADIYCIVFLLTGEILTF